MHSNGPVSIESRALGTLSYIRASMDSAGSLAVPGAAGIVMGTLGMIAAVFVSLPALSDYWLGIWLATAITAFVLGSALVFRQATQRGRANVSGPLRKFALCLGPSLIAGAVLTFILWRVGIEQLIPGTWLLLYGCGVVSTSTVTTAPDSRLIATMGALFIALGIVAFAAPAHVHTLILACGFGVLHLVFGLLIGRLDHGN